MTSKTIVFFGSGPVAAASLERLARHFPIEAVITKQKPAHHRGDFPVIELAQELNLPVLYANTRPELTAVFESNTFASQLGIVIDYGVIIEQKVIDDFSLGIVNSHFSLLPEWRGADPITFSILSGQPQTGVSLMIINDKLDEGLLLGQAPYELAPDINTVQLTNALIDLSDVMLQQIIPLYFEGTAKAALQEDVSITPSKIPTYSRKLTKDDGVIDWNKPAVVIEREVRAFIEWPKSRTVLIGKEVVISKSHVMVDFPLEKPDIEPGELRCTNNQLIIGTSDGILVIDELTPSGRNRTTGESFIAGHHSLIVKL